MKIESTYLSLQFSVWCERMGSAPHFCSLLHYTYTQEARSRNSLLSRNARERGARDTRLSPEEKERREERLKEETEMRARL